jgi:prolyl-tRNA editing enzyme YbaK/EbsC (Cys-tRNA(Pro) deacylase)
MDALPAAARRVADAAAALGLSVAVKEMPASTRTAEEAAAACGCGVAQIVKSLVFAGVETGRPLLLLVSGRNRVDEEAVAARIGERFTRADPRKVREWTGYAIGGIPPLGHAEALPTWMDEDLLIHDQVFAAAGTPTCLFGVAPRALAEATGARIIRMD